MPSKYALRIWWYISLGLVTVAVVRFHAPILGAALLSAVADYVPASILWMWLGPLLQKAFQRDTKLFGMEERTLLIAVILGGACISALFLFVGRATAASFGIVLILAGVDGLILSREDRLRTVT
jgi:hypothetical protein